MMVGQHGETKPRVLLRRDVAKFRIYEKSEGAYWLVIEFEINGTVYGWIPRLEHQWQLAKGIAICEDAKYQFGKGRIIPGQFLIDAMLPESKLDDEMIEEYSFARSASIRGVEIEGAKELCSSLKKRDRNEVIQALIEHLFERLNE